MVETKPYRSERWHWHYSRDHYHPRNTWNKRGRDTLYAFIQYFCGPRYNFMQALKVLSLLLLAGTCLFNLRLIIDTNKRLQNQRIILELDSDSDVVPFDEDEYFSHLNAKQDQKPDIPEKFDIKVVSSKNLVDISVNGESVHRDEEDDIGRGIHVVVLHETTGSVMAQRVFDTYTPRQDEALLRFLDMVKNNRIFIFALKDEASFQLRQPARDKLKELGSKMIDKLSWRSMWAMVSSRHGILHAENLEMARDVTSWADDVIIEAEVSSQISEATVCKWKDSPENRRRREFCSRFDGYGDLCSCTAPSLLTFDTEPVSVMEASNVPLAVIASNRPQYLYRMLRSLLSARGVRQKMIVIFIDGHFEEPYEVAKLFDLQVYQHVPVGVKNARISQHYKASLGATFTLFPSAKQIIILEEDLDISPDFFSFFSQTMHLLDEDASIYCISAWNDQGYDHSSSDPSMLYRVETMPGLGWMLKRSLFKEELEPHWPSQDKRWDWDMWMRTDTVRKGRECIIPDISRTYHFGSVGINMNSYFFEMYFKAHSLNRKEIVRFQNVESLKKSGYERLMHSLVRDSVILDHTKSPCDNDFVSDGLALNASYVAYFRMDKEEATDVFLEVLHCLKIWDLEARGLHRGAFRTFIKNRHVVFVGYPVSPYSLYKPTFVEPFYLEPTKKKDIIDT